MNELKPEAVTRALDFLCSLPERPHMTWVNGKFDTLFLEEQWKIPADLLTIDDDIMIMAYVLEMGQRKGLKELAKRHCNAEDWDCVTIPRSLLKWLQSHEPKPSASLLKKRLSGVERNSNSVSTKQSV